MFEKPFLGTFVCGIASPSLNRVGGFSSDGNVELSKFLLSVLSPTSFKGKDFVELINININKIPTLE